MKSSPYPRSLALTLLLGSVALISGCGGMDVGLPDSVSNPQVQGPPMEGSVFGGHAPIVGSHVYLLQPGHGGTGTAATSILGNNGATSANGFAITANTADPNIPVGAKYVTTNSSGNFSFTGAYNCTVGEPVYAYSYGGNATGSTVATSKKDVYSNVTATISAINVSGAVVNSSTGTATYTVTLSSPEAVAAGDTVTIAGLTGNLSIVNGAQTALSAGLTTTTFEFTATDVYGTYTYGFGNTYYESVGNGNYSATTGPNGNYGNNHDIFGNRLGSPGTPAFGTAGTAKDYVVTGTTATTNPITQLAILGNCPSSGNFSTAGNGQINFLYSNEVSTVAAAYVFQPFTSASNNNAWDIATSGSAQALVGIENAANTAAQLYAIQGNAQVSGANDGEGHIANYQTQQISVNGTTITYTPNKGNGIVPQSTIDALANSLAACIDSTPGTGGLLSAQCNTLFNTATDGGATVESGDKAPTDTATAAINIARYPAGNSSAHNADPTYASDIFGVATGTVPFSPTLSTAPHDWTLAISYPNTAPTGYSHATANGTLGLAESIAVDNIGQIWITAQTNDDIIRWSPLGVENAETDFTFIPGYVAIDGSNNAWTGNATSTSGIFYASNNGEFSTTYGSGYNKAYVVVTNNAGDAFFFANTSGTGSNYEMFEYGPGGTGPTQYNISPSVISAGNNVGHGAIDASGDLWITSETSNQIARISSTGVSAFTPIVTAQQPEFPAIDHAGNAWIAVQETNSNIYVVSPTGGQTVLTSATTGAELTSTFGAAIDGNGNAWFVNRCGNYGSCGSSAGENTLFEINGSTQTAITPSTNLLPQIQYVNATTPTSVLYGSLNLAIDPSGNIWITNYTGNSVAEIVGAAAPVVTPLSLAAGTNKLGAKP